MYVLSSRVTACNVYVFCKLFAHVFWPRQLERLCLLSGYARFRLFQRLGQPLLTEKYKQLVRPLHPVCNGAVRPGMQHPPRLGGGTARHHSFKSIVPYGVISDSDTSSDATAKCNFRYVDHVDNIGLVLILLRHMFIPEFLCRLYWSHHINY